MLFIHRVELVGSEVIVHLNGNHPLSTIYLRVKEADGQHLELTEFLILAPPEPSCRRAITGQSGGLGAFVPAGAIR